jgi:hypothetical protein
MKLPLLPIPLEGDFTIHHALSSEGITLIL